MIDEIKNRFNRSFSKSMISKWENSKEEPAKFTDVIILSNFFGVTTDYLIGISDNKYTDDKLYKSVPVLGNIAAGLPIMACENIEGFERLDEGETADFCLRVKGDSMIGCRICSGDLVFIKKQDEVENGEIAAVQVNGDEATIKRFYKYDDRIILHSENPTFKDMIYTKADRTPIRILGKVKYVKFEVE
jgi:repressor LexA